MNYSYPYYMICEQGTDDDTKRLYRTCFTQLMHSAHNLDEHAYFLQFKAAALTSIILRNKDLHKNKFDIIYAMNALNNIGYIDRYEWSMMKQCNAYRVIEHPTYRNEYLGWRRSENVGDDTYDILMVR